VDHIEKTFDFAGMPARSGVTSATMVEAGFTVMWDVFVGFNNLFDSYPSIMTGRLSQRIGQPLRGDVDQHQALLRRLPYPSAGGLLAEHHAGARGWAR
jgi:hypothetical protein